VQLGSNTTDQEAVASATQAEPYWRLFVRRLLVMNIGLFVMAAGIDAIVLAHLGASPWDVLHLGVTLHSSISFGAAQQLVGLVILIAACWMAKSWPTIGCLINILMVGFYSDLIYALVPDSDSWAVRIVQFVIGLLLCGYGAGIYISSRLGAGPRDWLMLSLHRKTGIRIRWVRTCLEIFAVSAGIALGGPFSVGTIVFSLTIGHPTEWGIKWAEKFFRPFVERREHSNEVVH
jgi:uncharacterized membrane protein YczE